MLSFYSVWKGSHTSSGFEVWDGELRCEIICVGQYLRWAPHSVIVA